MSTTAAAPAVRMYVPEYGRVMLVAAADVDTWNLRGATLEGQPTRPELDAAAQAKADDAARVAAETETARLVAEAQLAAEVSAANKTPRGR